MISYYKQQEQLHERQRAYLKAKAKAGKPTQFDFRSGDELRADWAKESKTKRLHKLLWSAGNRAMPQHLLDEITKLKKELASSSNSATL
jgi:hypothetical protein